MTTKSSRRSWDLRDGALWAREYATLLHAPQTLRASAVSVLGLHTLAHNKRLLLEGRDCLVWTHLGLGDQIAMYSAISSLVDAGMQVTLAVDRRYLEMVADLYSTLSNVRPVPVSFAPQPGGQRRTVRRLSRELRLPLLTAGHEVYRLLARAFPDRSINWHLNASISVIPTDLRRWDRDELVSVTPQVAIPSAPYAFIDHHPGTEREIPATYLRRISERGLTLVENPRSVPLTALIALMDGAEELHLVSSAPLCLALTLDLGHGLRVRYRTGNTYPLLVDYPADWKEIALDGDVTRAVDRQAEFRSSLSSMRWIEHLARQKAQTLLAENSAVTADTY